MKTMFSCLLILVSVYLAGNVAASQGLFDDPSLVIFQNRSDQELLVVIDVFEDNQKPVVVCVPPHEFSADLRLAVGEHVVQVATKSHGALGATQSFVISIQSQGYSQIFYIY